MSVENGSKTTESEERVSSIFNERLSLEAFSQLSGRLGGIPFVKLVVDRPSTSIHFVNNAVYKFHADFITQELLNIPQGEADRDIDKYNFSFYQDPNRRFFLGILAFYKGADQQPFFTLETVEVDTMSEEMLREFYGVVRKMVDPIFPVLLKPANHLQEGYLASLDKTEIPRILAHDLFSSSKFSALHPGTTVGRLRCFMNEAEYAASRATIEWHDIIVMAKVPEDIPRVGGIINAEHVTPLSHTNVLASGWKIPNCIQIGIFDRIRKEGLNEKWVRFEVATDRNEVGLEQTSKPEGLEKAPRWQATKIRLEAPEVHATEILPLARLRMSDRFRYGTKAANLGELYHVLEHGSEKLPGFYKIRRPPRANLLPYLASLLGTKEAADLARAAWGFLRDSVRLSNGIAIPFSVQQKFLESSPKIQQAIGKLKMALELDAPQVDPLCIQLQRMIIETRFPDNVREEIDSRIARYLGGVADFVVRSSSNAEDLQNFSAAGIYESVNHVTTADRILESVKHVWASVLSPRSVRLRQDVGISLDDTYMGVIIQEQVPMHLGGVMVTTNPISKSDFRNVYINASLKSVQDVVQGTDLPLQFLFNTVEGGGRTISLGSAKEDLPEAEKARLQNLALAGRLLQAHFSPDYTFSHPVDVEWLSNEEGIFVLQLRPYTV